jgi:hypothetical protein
MNSINNTELSSHEGTRSEFNPGKAVIKLGIDVHQEFYVVVVQEGGGNPKPAQRFRKGAFLSWAARLKQKSGAQIHAVYEAFTGSASNWSKPRDAVSWSITGSSRCRAGGNGARLRRRCCRSG